MIGMLCGRRNRNLTIWAFLIGKTLSVIRHPSGWRLMYRRYGVIVDLVLLSSNRSSSLRREIFAGLNRYCRDPLKPLYRQHLPGRSPFPPLVLQHKGA